MFNPDKYRSVVWQKGGRTFPRLDCFGLVNEIRRDLSLPEWPDFAGVTKDDGGLDREARKLMLNWNAATLVKVRGGLFLRFYSDACCCCGENQWRTDGSRVWECH